MVIIRENKSFSYSIEEVDIVKDEQGNDTDIYQFGLILKILENEYTILLEFDMTKKTLYSMCVQETKLSREEMDLVYTYIMMLREELKSHMKYMLSLH